MTAFFRLVRPYTLIAPAVAGFFGTVIVQKVLSIVFPFHYVGIAVLTLAFLQAGGQVINQVADIEIDRINKPWRPLPAGEIAPETATKIGLFLLIIPLVLNLVVNVYAYTLALVGVILAFFYSIEPIKAKRRHWAIALVWQALARGLLPPLYLFSLAKKVLHPFAVILSLIGFTWVFAFQPTKDFTDVKGDRMFGIQTLPVVYGEEESVRIISYFGVVPLLLSLLLWPIDYGFVCFTAGLLAFYLVITVLLAVEEYKKAWMTYYLGLGFIYLGVSTVMVL